MAKNPSLPSPAKKVMSKTEILQDLQIIDQQPGARDRILSIESQFRNRINTHVASLPIGSSRFSKFNTSPFVLMLYTKQKGYHFVSEIEHDILPAKLFSSMETSAGRMVQDVVLPVFGWESVLSSMHSATSVIDARRKDKEFLELATLKSGPRCLNDEMSKDIADDIVSHAEEWAAAAGVDHIEFTYAALYGTPKQSNKKDWHILRNIVATVGNRFVLEYPWNTWKCVFRIRSIKVGVTVRIGADWWSHLGSEMALLEFLVALIRACVIPTVAQSSSVRYQISDLADIVSTRVVPAGYNVSLLQQSQFEWLFFLVRHFCDDLTD